MRVLYPCFAFRGKTLPMMGENQCLERETWALPHFRDLQGGEVGVSPFLFISELPIVAWQGRASREGKVNVGSDVLAKTSC